MKMGYEAGNHAADLRLHIGAGDGNRTRTISLGSTQIGAVVRCDLRGDLLLSARI